MADFPIFGVRAWDAVGVDAAATTGSIVTGSGTINTKGSWSELVASITRRASWIAVNLQQFADGDSLVDIGVGGAGSEKVIIPNIYVHRIAFTARDQALYLFPITIAAGSRIAARGQSTSVDMGFRVHCQLAYGGFPTTSLSAVDAMGDATADSGGTSIDPGGTTDTKGSWAQLIASTVRPVQCLILAFGTQLNTARVDNRWLVDIGIGAATSEQILIPDISIRSNVGADIITPLNSSPFFLDIPAGTRVAARAQSDSIDATDRLFDLIAYGVY